MTTRQQIEKILYKRHINVALKRVENAQKFKTFAKEVDVNLFDTIKYIADSPMKIRHLMMWTKAPRRFRSSQVHKSDPNQKLIDEVGIALGAKTIGDVKLSAFLTWIGTQGGQSALDKIGIQGNFLLKNKDLINYFDNYSNLIINSVDETTKEWIARKLQNGRENFMNPDEIANLLTTDGKGISSVRAKMISVTESAKGLTTVELTASKRYGIQQKTWHTSEDDRVEAQCISLDGKTVDIDEQFPGGLDGVPAHILCRCFLDYPLPDDFMLPENPWLGE